MNDRRNVGIRRKNKAELEQIEIEKRKKEERRTREHKRRQDSETRRDIEKELNREVFLDQLHYSREYFSVFMFSISFSLIAGIIIFESGNYDLILGPIIIFALSFLFLLKHKVARLKRRYNELTFYQKFEVNVTNLINRNE